MVSMPQYLSRPMAILFWESDELVIGLMALTIAFVVTGIVAFLIAIGVFTMYRRFRKSAGRGFLQHLPYILGLKSFEGFPHAYIDEFEE